MSTVKIDMAKRIMHSILPYIADPKQIDATKGVVDYNSLIAAAEGRFDIIKYGTSACVKEMGHYRDRTNELLAKMNDFLKAKEYEKAADICVKGFGDPNQWDNKFGGEAWKKIAVTVRNIIKLNDALQETERNKRDSKYLDTKNLILNYMVVEMNVFDGLSHNTASIMNNIIGEEIAAGVYSSSRLSSELKAIMDMRDATELRNPISVFEAIEDLLKSTGDIFRWKDWTRQLRSHPSYKNEDYHNQLERIRLRKSIIDWVKKINAQQFKLDKMLIWLEVQAEYNSSFVPEDTFRDICCGFLTFLNELVYEVARIIESSESQSMRAIKKQIDIYRADMDKFTYLKSKATIMTAVPTINTMVEYVREI